MGLIMAIYMCSRAFLGKMYLNFLRMNSGLEAFWICFKTCSFQERLEVSVTPRLCRLDVLVMGVLLNRMGGITGGVFLERKL